VASAGPDAETVGTVDCPVKKGTQTVPLSGGAVILSSGLLANLNSTWPDSDGIGWDVRVDNAGASAVNFQVYAVCAQKPGGYKQPVGVITVQPGTDTGTAWDSCSGKNVVITGGGADVTSGFEVGTLDVNESWPQGTNGWQVGMDNDTGSNATADYYDVCGKFKASETDYQTVSGPVESNPADSQSGAHVSCPSGTSVLGGGIESYQPLGGAYGQNVSSSYPVTGGWSGEVDNQSSTSLSIQAFAVCAT
jgi:hypothetical protein